MPSMFSPAEDCICVCATTLLRKGISSVTLCRVNLTRSGWLALRGVAVCRVVLVSFLTNWGADSGLIWARY